MEIDVNLNEVKDFVQSDKFIQFMLNNTTNIGVSAFILQTILEKISELESEE